MTYEGEETSIESGEPVELYRFQIGTETFRYTSAEDTVTFGGDVYVSRQINRTAPAQADGERRNTLRVTLPAEDPVCSRYVGVVPGQPMVLTLLRFHRNDTEVHNMWSGQVIGAVFKKAGALCDLNCVTSESAFSRNLPQFKYQGLCNHVLYDGQCSVAKASFQFTAPVSVVSGNTITVPGLLAAKGAGWALGGYVSSDDTDYRTVVGQAGDVLTLQLPFNNAILNLNVDVFAGCDHTLATCNTKFSNAINYGGFAFVPVLNPFNTSLR